MTSEPRTPSTPQSLAQLRDSILERHNSDGWEVEPLCLSDCTPWPCDAYRLATLLSVENVAAGLRAIGVVVSTLDEAHRLLEAIGASHD